MVSYRVLRRDFADPPVQRTGLRVRMSSATRWLGPGSGVLALIAVVISEGISGSIDSEPTDSSSTMLAEFSNSADDIRTGAILGVLGAGFLLVFIGDLRARLRDRGADWAGSVFAAGGVALIAAVLVFVAAELTGAEAGDQGQGDVAQAVVYFNWNGVWLFSPGLLAIGVGVAVASFSFRALPIWLGVFGVLVGVSALAPWVGVPLFGIWVLAASISEIVSMARTQPSTDSAQESETSAT